MEWKYEVMQNGARKPEQSHEGDLGLDLFSCEDIQIRPGETVSVGTGIRILFPEGWGGIIKDRSSVAFFHSVFTAAGVIDQGYRGEIKVVMYNFREKPYFIAKGDKIAQLIPTKVTPVTMTRVEGVYDEGTETTRGSGGFGSTGS